MAKPKGAGKALRLNLPGAPQGWHYLPGVPGLFHPVIPTPLASIGMDEAEAEKLGKNKSVHLELVTLTPAEEDAANEALAEAGIEALAGVKAHLPLRQTAEDRDRILAAAAAAKAVKTTTEQED